MSTENLSEVIGWITNLLNRAESKDRALKMAKLFVHISQSVDCQDITDQQLSFLQDVFNDMRKIPLLSEMNIWNLRKMLQPDCWPSKEEVSQMKFVDLTEDLKGYFPDKQHVLPCEALPF